MPRNRTYSDANTDSSGYGSEDRGGPSANNTPQNTPQRRKKNNKNQNHNSPHHNNHNVNNTNGPNYHDMTLLCHRVDIFDDFVPSSSGRNNNKSEGGDNSAYAGGLVPIRCLGIDRGCMCNTPCIFCHTVIEDGSDDEKEEPKTTGVDIAAMFAGGGEKKQTAQPDINPNLAFLFAGGGAKKPQTNTVSDGKEEKIITKTTITNTLVVDPIFAQNHGLLSDNVEGGIKVKKYHHPPVGRYQFVPPLIELPSFFDESEHPPKPQANGHANHNGTNGHATQPAVTETKEEEMDSFFDDFCMKEKTEEVEYQSKQQQQQQKHHNENHGTTLVFRAPLKTVVKKTITSNNPNASGKCICQSQHEDLKKGLHQPNPYDPAVVHQKYWAQRRRLFKKFDEGIQLDPEGWYSVTPEAVADHVASRFADASGQLMAVHNTNNNAMCTPDRGNKQKKNSSKKPMVILDAFCGCGGNAIAFSKLPFTVVSLIVCIDLDRTKLRKAAHNASIYRIPPNRIVFIEANSVAVMERCYRDGKLIMDPPPRTPEALSAYPPRELYDDFTIGGIDLLSECAPHIDAIFMDPPWGGICYGEMGKDGYDLGRDMKIQGCAEGSVGFPPTPEIDGMRLLNIAAAATSTRFVAYDLPKNVNKRSLAHAALEAGYEGNSKLEEHYLNGRLKTVTAYFGQDFRHLLDLKKNVKGSNK